MCFTVHCSNLRGANGGWQWYAAQDALGQHLSRGGLCRWQHCMWFRRFICRKAEQMQDILLLFIDIVIYCYHPFI
jgi:hypothetical protein